MARTVPTASAQLATVLAQLADERSGPLATVRGLIEHTAHRAALQPGTGPDTEHRAPGTGHRLELIAHRLHGIQQDLDATAARLSARPGRAPSAPVLPLTRAAGGHSP
ncbi:hypothetical protein EASAB2608_06588 [Streptomyces sp. EAS-AB2608]|uniref:hypothetical protein n=1 Tax=Streptomyces sp. EAS-AB2608 TaxID=2779671 RepID=UPI001BEDBDEF|nr:hypothetical protein [Streptomyces sp. EAS-AB2608]BCM71254.1 hypothetical protein EASAB2608_06588 [Streptomyces sp. EAS-AB2608]